MQSGFAAMPGAYVPTQRRAFDRNLVITIAQLLAVTQGILGLINGINALRLTIGVSRLFGGLGVPSLAGGFVADAVGLIALSVVVIALAVLATRPSNVARYLLVAWEVIAFAITATVIVQFPFFFGAPDLVVVTLLATGVGFVHPYIVLAMSAVIIFGFAVYPPTWEAYSR